MKTLYVDSRPNPGHYTLLEFTGPRRAVVGVCGNMKEAMMYTRSWSDRQVSLCEPCQVVFVNDDGDEHEIACAHTFTVALHLCSLTTAQTENLVEEFFGRIHDGAAHFARREFAEAFAEVIGITDFSC
jgi:hypothetical protein